MDFPRRKNAPNRAVDTRTTPRKAFTRKVLGTDAPRAGSRAAGCWMPAARVLQAVAERAENLRTGCAAYELRKSRERSPEHPEMSVASGVRVEIPVSMDELGPALRSLFE